MSAMTHFKGALATLAQKGFGWSWTDASHDQGVVWVADPDGRRDWRFRGAGTFVNPEAAVEFFTRGGWPKIRNLFDPTRAEPTTDQEEQPMTTTTIAEEATVEETTETTETTEATTEKPKKRRSNGSVKRGFRSLQVAEYVFDNYDTEIALEKMGRIGRQFRKSGSVILSQMARDTDILERTAPGVYEVTHLRALADWVEDLRVANEFLARQESLAQAIRLEDDGIVEASEAADRGEVTRYVPKTEPTDRPNLDTLISVGTTKDGRTLYADDEGRLWAVTIERV